MTPLKCTLQTTIFCLSVLFVVNETVDAFYFEDFHLYSDSAKLGFTYAGYSDGWFWGPSDRHPHGGIYDGRHEVLSGEFAAAVRWDNCGSNEAIWLTGRFDIRFQTNSILRAGNPHFINGMIQAIRSIILIRLIALFGTIKTDSKSN